MNSHNVILGINILNCDFIEILSLIDSSVTNKSRILISYANSNTINLTCKYPEFKKLLSDNFIVHPDGIGIHLASGILNKRSRNKFRFTGSDFYPVLAQHSIQEKYKLYFFGHNEETLKKISETNPELIVGGYTNGYRYNNELLLKDINSCSPEILIIGLGQPNQENWIIDNHERLKCTVIIAVGDGIKVFAGEKKRGPLFMQKAGLEWLSRLLINPKKYWKRYLLGNPLFLYRIIKAKFVKLKA